MFQTKKIQFRLSIRNIILSLIALLVILSGGGSSVVFGFTQDDLNSIINNTPFYDPNATACSATPGTSSTSPATVAAFVDKYGQMAYDNSIKTGVPYEFTLGQAILESGYGNSVLSAQYNNFFGIKATSSWTGATVSLPTHESVNGVSIEITASFRAYATAGDGFADHDNFLRANSRYAGAFQYSNDPIQFLGAVAAAGYATSPTYAKDVGSIVKAVQEYVASKSLWPPSSSITYAIAPPAADYSSSLADTSSSCPSPAGGDISAYKNPYRDIKGLVPMRIDEGVDYGGTGPIYALGNGTVVMAKNNAGWPGGNFVMYQLSDGPAAGKYVYFAENCPLTVSVGDQVTSNTVICNAINSFPFTESGWGGDPSRGSIAAAYDVYTPDGTATAYGQNFNDLLVKLGVPAGTYDFADQQGGKNLTGTLPAGWPTW